MQLFIFFAGRNLVERFELIATTGKNAKMPLIPIIQLSNPSAGCYLKRLRAKARLLIFLLPRPEGRGYGIGSQGAMFIEILWLHCY